MLLLEAGCKVQNLTVTMLASSSLDLRTAQHSNELKQTSPRLQLNLARQSVLYVNVFPLNYERLPLH